MASKTRSAGEPLAPGELEKEMWEQGVNPASGELRLGGRLLASKPLRSFPPTRESP